MMPTALMSMELHVCLLRGRVEKSMHVLGTEGKRIEFTWVVRNTPAK